MIKALHETHRRNVLLADLLMAARVDSHLVFPSEVQMILLRALVKEIEWNRRRSRVVDMQDKCELQAYANDELDWEQDYTADLGAELAEEANNTGATVCVLVCLT